MSSTVEAVSNGPQTSLAGACRRCPLLALTFDWCVEFKARGSQRPKAGSDGLTSLSGGCFFKVDSPRSGAG